MATNPLYNTNDSPNNATQPTKSVNNQGVYVPRTHNTFDISYFLYKTQKFGQYEPFFATEGVPGDTIPLSSSHNVRALPMSSPFLSQLDLNKDYFLVPNNAIQPNTWDYIYTDPSQGDDVPENAHNLFPIFKQDGRNTIFQQMIHNTLTLTQDLGGLSLRWLLISELFLSSGCLLNVMGYKLNPIFTRQGSSKPYSFDNFFDSFCRGIQSMEIRLVTDYVDESYFYSRDGESDITLLEALSLLRRYGSSVSIEDFVLDETEVTEWSCDYSTLPTVDYDINQTINLDRLCAYQLVCSQFYVNPKVDFLYNAQLYRDNIFTLYRAVMLGATPLMFSYNGILVPYDYFSMFYYDNINQSLFLTSSASKAPLYYDYYNAIFGFRESLRFGDYFTDSRTRPLAIGDDSLEVGDDSTISVIDMSRRIVLQRFRNAVIKLGQNAGDYLRGIFGTSPSPDYHVPKFIAHQDFNISGFEVANTTSDSQGDIVTNLSTRDDRFAFEIEIDMPCVVVGISYFSCPRAYSQTKERVFFHKNRYDMFNPMLQAYGDQAVYNNERTDLRPNQEVFGYQSRNNEYKQKYSQVSGGFVQYLPAWSFVTDSLFNPVVDLAISNTQSPDYIRAHDYEFNRFFQAIPGYSLASAFHFIVVYNNKCMATRPMEVNPNTL